MDIRKMFMYSNSKLQFCTHFNWPAASWHVPQTHWHDCVFAQIHRNAKKRWSFFCPLLVFLNFTCCEYNISVNLVYSQASTLLESGHVKGRKSLVGAAAFPDLCKTLEGPVQASGFLFWSKVQLSLWLWPVKSFSYCIKRSLCGPSGR